MNIRVIPGRRLIIALAASAGGVLVALVLGMPATIAFQVAAVAILLLVAAAAADYTLSVRRWRRSSARMIRRLPPAFAIAAERPVQLAIETSGADSWRCELYDHADSSL